MVRWPRPSCLPRLKTRTKASNPLKVEGEIDRNSNIARADLVKRKSPRMDTKFRGAKTSKRSFVHRRNWKDRYEAAMKEQ